MHIVYEWVEWGGVGGVCVRADYRLWEQVEQEVETTVHAAHRSKEGGHGGGEPMSTYVLFLAVER